MSGAGGAATRCGRPTTRATTADQVCIIPGTQAVAGITRVDEPVGELLDRFEQASIDEVLAPARDPTPVVSRRQARADVTGPLAVVLDSPDVLWAGRTAINPVHRIGARRRVAGQRKPKPVPHILPPAPGWSSASDGVSC